MVLDTRNSGPFAEAHIKGAINIPIGHSGGVKLEYEDGNFAIWVGTLIAPTSKILLVSEQGKEQEAIERLGRIGYAANITGVLKSGMRTWVDAGEPIDKFEKIVIKNADTIRHLQANNYVIVDTRTAGEYSCALRGHVNGAINLPLAELPQSCSALDRSKKYAVYCLGGFRSTITTSLLRREGYDATDIVGGYDHGVAPHACDVTSAQPEFCEKMKAEIAALDAKPVSISI